MVWGPLAGYFAARAAHPLALVPVRPEVDAGQWPMAFDVSIGVRKGDRELRDRLDASLVRHAPEVRSLLADYHVPVTARP